jgi:hypothetical protein
VPRESREVKKVRAYLKGRYPGCWGFKVQGQAMRGIPDLIYCIRGLFVAFEIKDPKAKSDPNREKLQEYTCELIKDARGFSFPRVNSENIDELCDRFDKYVATYLPTYT